MAIIALLLAWIGAVLAATRYGVDSRDGRDWQSRDRQLR
ncbi:MAG: hypothetical protein QOG49_1645 [Frankiaceae bacterium]|nr:hypothetical protein [Frankiaceae bacterium]